MRWWLRVPARSAAAAVGTVCLVSLFAGGGCSNTEAEYTDIVQARSAALDGLKTQGAKISEKKMPVVGMVNIVDLSGSKAIDDKTFEMLRSTGKPLFSLDLSGTNVTDAHLAILNDKELSGGLTNLNLSETEISDKGLENMSLLGYLATLNLQNTKVTPGGVKAFLKARAENNLITSKAPKIKQ